MTKPDARGATLGGTLRWVRVHNKDELEAFYRGVLPNIIREAKYHGYAIGVHGSLRRDLDLIAVPWSDDHSDKDDLARAIQEAACGIPQERYQWGPKPCGRVAVSFPVCWTEESEAFPGETNLGHIDLSVMTYTRSETAQKPIAWRWRIVSTDEIPWLYATEKPNNLNEELFWDVEPLFAASIPSAIPRRLTVETFDGDEPAVACGISWIIRNHDGQPDHACATCVPGADSIIEGFICYYHQALELKAEHG